jgi:hypothetical protein
VGLGSSCRWCCRVCLSLRSLTTYALLLAYTSPSISSTFISLVYFPPPLIPTPTYLHCHLALNHQNQKNPHSTKPYNAFPTHPVVVDYCYSPNSHSLLQNGRCTKVCSELFHSLPLPMTAQIFCQSKAFSTWMPTRDGNCLICRC